MRGFKHDRNVRKHHTQLFCTRLFLIWSRKKPFPLYSNFPDLLRHIFPPGLVSDPSILSPETPAHNFISFLKDARQKMIENRLFKSWFGAIWCQLVKNPMSFVGPKNPWVELEVSSFVRAGTRNSICHKKMEFWICPSTNLCEKHLLNTRGRI